MDFQTEEITKIVPAYKQFVDNNYIFDFNNNFKINYYEDQIYEQKYFEEILGYLLNRIENVKGKENKCFLSLILFKLIFSNISFILKYKIFQNIIHKKIMEIKNNDYLFFEKYKKFTTENKNPIDIWFYIYNEKILKHQEMSKLYQEITLFITPDINIDIEEIKSTHPILHLLDDPNNLNNHNIKFIFKLTNEYTFEKFNSVLSTLHDNNGDTVILVLAIFEIIINNIHYLKENEENKKVMIQNLNYHIKNHFQLFDNYKKYNYGINPLVTIKKMMDFYL